MTETTSARIEKRQRVMGWVAVALSTLAAAVLGIVAGERVVTQDWLGALLHSAQMLVIIAAALVALRWPRVGGSITTLAGLGLVLEMVITVIGGPELLALWPPGALFLLLLIVAGPLYFRGRPSRRRLTYAVIVVVPLVLFGITSLLPGPGEELPAQRVSPATEAVVVNAGQSLTFTAAVQDPDGDLRSFEWSVTDSHHKQIITQQVELAGGQAQAEESFEVVFSDVGDFTVGGFFTAASGRVGEVSWLVTVKSP